MNFTNIYIKISNYETVYIYFLSGIYKLCLDNKRETDHGTERRRFHTKI